MLNQPEIKLHLWPWSFGVKEETKILNSDKIEFPFYGSPVLSLPIKAKPYLSKRYEYFYPFGPSIINGYRLYEIPYSISNEFNKYFIRFEEKTFGIQLAYSGGKSRFESKDKDSELSLIVLSWAQFFDDLLEEANKRWKGEKRFPWNAVLDFIKGLKKEQEEPRKALIVHIAETIFHLLPITVNSARKILFRKRLMLPASRINEMDSVCLQWYIRQPGRTPAEKASLNRQNLLGVARRETYNTLENRVLKDFISRCILETKRYLTNEVARNSSFEKSRRASIVRSFRCLCLQLKQVEFMEDVSPPPTPVNPNYVLQNDFRYRKIWKLYKRLLRKEDEEDKIWDWQTRTWADISRLLLCTALYELSVQSQREKKKIVIREILKSDVKILKEQLLGCRLHAGSEPGPFVLQSQRDVNKYHVLEVVHSELAKEHKYTKQLGSYGGHLYLVLTPLQEGKKKVIVNWAIHTAGSNNHPSWQEIADSAERSLFKNNLNPDKGIDLSLELYGMVIASDLGNNIDFFSGGKDKLWLLKVPADYSCWDEAIETLILVLEDIIEKVLL